MKVLSYVRVSTDKQVEQGLGLELQREAIKKWAKTHGHKIVGHQADEGISGSNGLDTRAGLAEALDIMRSGQADGLVVYRLDRLARDLVLQEQLLAEVRRMGRNIFTTSAAEAGYLADDPDDPSRRLIRQVLGAVSEYERAMIRLRLLSGRRRKAEKGGFAFGSPSYGFKAEARALVPDDRESAGLMRIKGLRAEGASLRQIAATLTAEGHEAKRGQTWHPESVRRVIRRLEAAGRPRWEAIGHQPGSRSGSAPSTTAAPKAAVSMTTDSNCAARKGAINQPR